MGLAERLEARKARAAVKPGWELDEGEEIAPGRSVVERLGGGRRYEVYLVWDERLHAPAVAKLLRPDRVEEEGSQRALRREAELLGRLAHPSILRALDSACDGRYPHVLVEFLDGVTLRRLLNRHGAVPLEQLLPAALAVASALHYLAREDVVHLDVKPANIVMVAPPRLIDLGSARTVALARERRKPVGTVSYMSPEQCDPQGALGPPGPPADVWGLGATLFHAIAGEPPFVRPLGVAATDPPEVRFPQLVDDPPHVRGDAPRELLGLVSAMLERGPGSRPTAAEVFAALEALG